MSVDQPARCSSRTPPRRALHAAGLAIGLALALGACRGDVALHKEARWPTPPRGAVACEHPLATEIGIEILERGGNAADAAVATALALAVVYPQAGNLGGGGFALWVPHAGPARAFDFRETAPAAARRELYLDAEGKPDPARSLAGPFAVAVPGTPAGLHELFEQCGSRRFTLAQLAQPAIALAQRGFAVDAWLERDLASPKVRAKMNAAARDLFYPGGVALRAGTLLRQPELAQTLALFANRGRDGFYTGRVADAIVAELESARAGLPAGTRGSGVWLGPDDLERYRAVERQPLFGWFRGMQIVAMPPPSSGGLVVLQALGVLEGLPLDAQRSQARAAHALEHGKDGRPSVDDPGLDERMVHWWIEALRRAFADRAAHLGDPDFVDVPVENLLSSEWIAARRISIGENADPGVPAWPAEREGTQTTHLSVLDEDGNAVSLTTTLNSEFGSGILVRRAGFLLNDEIDDFAIHGTVANQYGLVGTRANALEPLKRPLSSMSPLVVRDGGHAVTMVLGSPGGPRIISALVQVLLRVLVLEQPLADAVAAPRLHQQWNPVASRFEAGFDPEIVAALENRRGHQVEWSTTRFGSVQAIWLEAPGEEPLAISDPRRGGNAQVEGRKASEAAKPPPLPAP